MAGVERRFVNQIEFAGREREREPLPDRVGDGRG